MRATNKRQECQNANARFDAGLTHVWYGDKQGSGYISKSRNALPVTPQTVIVAGETVKPGTHTTLSGYFCRPIEYLGVIDFKWMIFYLGSEQDLFASKHYYQEILRVSERRLWESFAPGSGRDFNYIGGEWK
jgi:hypothetical protein